MNKSLIVLTLTLLLSSQLLAAEISDITNFRQYSETLASSGQPDSEQLKLLAEQGIERIFYLAYSDNDTAIVAEDRKVLDLGMDYAHIPVDFMNPTLRDFQQLAALMQLEPDQNTLVHCQINLRASAFSFLYRIIYEDVPVNTALENMHSVWAPNDVWFNFIQTVASHHDIDLFCDSCDWRGREVEITD